MDAVTPTNSQLSLVAAHTRNFRSSTIMLVVAVACNTIAFLKHLNHLPMVTAFGLAVGIVLLVMAWKTAARAHESILMVLATKRETTAEKQVNAILSTSATALERGLYTTSIIAFILLMAFAPMLRRL